MISKIYQRRFATNSEFKKKMWQTLYDEFFIDYIPANSTIIDIGAGYCEFINSVNSPNKYAFDINPDIVNHASPNVTIIKDLKSLEDSTFDIVFISNFLEHLTKPEITKIITESHRILKQAGKLLILYPNIRYCYKDYWMFFDHITPLDDRSLSEIIETESFKIIENKPRFLPFSTKTHINSIFLLKLYINFPPIHKLLGQQGFMYARKL